MATYLSNELANVSTGLGTTVPVGYKPTATSYAGRLRRIRATFNHAAQGTSDTLVFGYLPAGSVFAFGVLTSTATLGASATLAIGVAGATGKYRTAATYTAANTPTFFGNAAAVAETPLAAETQVIGTIAVAALPNNAPDYFTVDLYYTMP